MWFLISFIVSRCLPRCGLIWYERGLFWFGLTVLRLSWNVVSAGFSTLMVRILLFIVIVSISVNACHWCLREIVLITMAMIWTLYCRIWIICRVRSFDHFRWFPGRKDFFVSFETFLSSKTEMLYRQIWKLKGVPDTFGSVWLKLCEFKNKQRGYLSH